jgi:hypothetical protein
MKKISITTVQTKVTLAETMIEDHINRMHHPDKSINENVLSKNFQNINWCCEHSLVEGTVEISFSAGQNSSIKQISIPVATRFLVVCTKEKHKDYKVTWSCSLS